MTAVYKAISNVAREMAETGIKKGSVNQQQGFMFRGIDAVYNALAPALVKHGLLILPRIIERTVTERQTQRGGLLFYVVVKAEFEFVSVEDGSKHTVVTYGEAMDSGDKATNKAMSIAYKYAAFQTFCIPTEETAIDADAEVHNVAPRTPDQILKDFTNSAMAITDLNILKKEFGETWKLLRKTPEQSKAKEVYNIRKSELEKM
ncbi:MULTISPECIES: ERF family protein [Proteus]|uniref:Single-stranded DNA-binding protein n=1 Tax=Proteus columbae TaxID=1987580 RepID=A0A6I7DBI6_9GAMM|nr:MULTISPECIES: ERF family protein [Proteus]MBI6340472.1 ERF family protein [Proteus sp. PR00224]MDY3694759.1 ERF family protein [Proteus mirabilis]QHN10097.1 single-stranded DNA-binding protein [Proteus columbae]QIF97638.1 single-stranded DNA-binding protein [Proteus terrae subsp. cibarius]QKJ47738.1 ERF family protein [Proteus vulgaris]